LVADRQPGLGPGLHAAIDVEGFAAADCITWVNADVTRWVPRAAAFDLVLVAYLHLPAAQRRVVLCHAAAAVAPGGTLLVIGHDSTNLTTGVGGPQDPRVLFSPDDILTDVVEAGLRTVRAERVRRPVTAADGSAPPMNAIDALVRLERPTDPAARRR
jgi:hypothetical protein